MAESGLEIYLVASLGILSVLIVASNCFVCVLVCFNKTLRTYTNWLILSLAVSDILTGGVLLPIFLINPAMAASGYMITTILFSGVASLCAFNSAVLGGRSCPNDPCSVSGVLAALGVVVPYIFITFAYVRIFKQVRRSLALRRDYESVTEQMKQRARISADAQVAKVFCIVSSAFLLSWTPILYMTTAKVLNRSDIIPGALSTVSFSQ
ncbi:hypothetical protein OS493_004863 [Desmophyllum pertusum]|uniref:G-protein coupled receptors family 1 profile domain-containing protein n=1 Tax=Desmophyllum pertusum TaxID=174260 RepID=A0A9W9Z3W9_9CNID|nr:hypothetical protein OS493_004863 [Desmophyllum pertusum]